MKQKLGVKQKPMKSRNQVHLDLQNYNWKTPIFQQVNQTETYQEIYLQTRSTTSLEDTATGMQKQTFEESIIEMFGFPENTKELIPASSPIPDLTLDLGPALPLEDINLLDYLNENNII